MPDRRAPAPPADLLEWRPMGAAVVRNPPVITDPLVEPLWSGARALAHLDEGGSRIRIIDAFGVDLTAGMGALAGLVAAAIDAGDAIVDGVMTTEATRGGVGAAPITEPRTTITELVWRKDPGVEVVRRDKDENPIEGFVALDLLRLDGQSLLDLPLLERKRLLESVVRQSDRVRVSVHARPPVDAWVATWQGAGLRGAMLKAANSRYVPGGHTTEWRTITRVAGKR